MSKDIIQKILAADIKTVQGIPLKTDIYFNSSVEDSLQTFIDFMMDYGIKYVFYYVECLTHEDIEDALVTDEMIIKERIPNEYAPIIAKEVEKYNKPILKLKSRIGEELRVQFFFSYSGAIYSYVLSNDIDLKDPEVFLEELMEQHSDKINEISERKSEEKREINKKLLQQLEETLEKDERFAKCTNMSLRKDFAFLIYRDLLDNAKKEYPDLELYYYSEYKEIAEKVWKKLKISKIN